MSFARLAPAALVAALAGTLGAQITPDAGPAPRPTVLPVFGPRANQPVPSSALPKIMLVGYWPPTNEMLRPWSTDKTKNPGGWKGGDWENRGYDVHAFFPEFPNGSWPWGKGDFEVDYQDTSADFARITKQLRPQIILTFSRGFFGNSWEIELNARNWTRWSSDRRGATQPTPTPPDSSIPGNTYRRSSLPWTEIVAAIKAANVAVAPRLDSYGTGGSYLSEFLSFHGIWYQGTHRSPTGPHWCAAAGHVHVGTNVAVAAGTQAVEVQLRTVIAHVKRILRGDCQANHAFGGLGTGALTVCGQPLRAGGRADLLLSGAPASAPAALMLAASGQRVAILDRLVLGSAFTALPLRTNSSGSLRIPGIPGGGGPFSVFAQFVYPDQRILQGRVAASNVIQMRFQR